MFRAGRDRSANFLRAANEHQRVNLEIARGILSDVERHGGEGSGLVEWARRVVAKADEFRLEPSR